MNKTITYSLFAISLMHGSASLAADWYLISSDQRICFKRETPAERIKELQDGAEHVETKDLRNGCVEVGYYNRNYTNFSYRTYCPSEEQCEAALPKNQTIPDKYK